VVPARGRGNTPRILSSRAGATEPKNKRAAGQYASGAALAMARAKVSRWRCWLGFCLAFALGSPVDAARAQDRGSEPEQRVQASGGEASSRLESCESRAKRKHATQRRVRRSASKPQRAANATRVGARASTRKWASKQRKARRSARSRSDEKPNAQERTTSAVVEAPATSDVDSQALALDSDTQAERDQSEVTPADDSDVDSDCSASGAATCPPARGLIATLALHTGVTARSIEAPTISGLAKLETGFLPAVGLQFHVRSLGTRLFYDVALAYQSSLGAQATQAASDPQKPALLTSIHTHRFDAGVTTGVFLGDGPDSATLGLFLGYGVQALASVVELRVPRFSLHGPLARVALELPLGTPHLVLRLAPEVQYVLSVSNDLRAVSGLTLGGPVWTLGGEVSLSVLFTARFGIQLAYREAHTAVASVYGSFFEDIERFGLLALVVSYL
jgi:hypothetical protein